MTDRPMTLERLEQLKKAEPAIYFQIEEMFQKGTYTRREQELIRRLMDLGSWQLGAACSWFEYDLMRAPYEVLNLEYVMQKWDHITPAERPAITREAVSDRLANLRKEIGIKEAAIAEAKEKGHFWSIVPLLQFFDLPEEERVGKSCYSLLPYFMQQAYTRMRIPKQPRHGSIARWLGGIKRIRVSVSDRGGEVELERHQPQDPDQK